MEMRTVVRETMRLDIEREGKRVRDENELKNIGKGMVEYFEN